VYVGNAIGANNVRKAKYFGKLAQVVALLFSIIPISVMAVFRDQIIRIFSSE
jgi:Na+-driven multidrug efflux pump